MSIEQTVVINTDTKSLASLKTEIKEIQSQLDLTPSGTKEYDDLVIRLRAAKGELKDFKESTKGLDPDQRAAKLVNAFQGMTGAIQAAAGAVTLFGGSSENLEKVEKNLLGIIAIGGGIQSTIEGYNDAVDIIGPKLKGLGTSIKGAFTTATGAVNGFRVALASIGIGLVIAGVVALVENFDKLVPKTKTLADELGLTADEFKALSTDVAKQTTEINLLVNAVSNQNLTEEKRREALDELQKKYPNYFKNLGNDINDTENLIIQKNKLIDTLIREARIRATQEQITKIAAANIGKRIQLQDKLTKAQNDEAAALQATNKVLGTVTTTKKDYTLISAEEFNAQLEAAGATEAYRDAIFKLNLAQGERTSIQQQINDLNEQERKDTKKFIDLIDFETSAIEKNGGASKSTTEVKITGAQKEVNTLTTAVAAKRRQYEIDIENLNAAKNEELKAAIGNAEKIEGIGVKYDALQVERGKKLGNDLLQVVEESGKRLQTKDEEVLKARAEIQLNGNQIINKNNADAINAAIAEQDKLVKESNDIIVNQLETNVKTAESTLNKELSFAAKLIEEYKTISGDNYDKVFIGADKFYNILVERLKEYGVEVDKETADQIRQQAEQELTARQNAQIATDKYYRDAITLLRQNGKEGNDLADKLEKERLQKFDENQKAKVDKAIEYGEKEVDAVKKTEEEKAEILEFGLEQTKSFIESLNSLADARTNNEINNVKKQTEAQIELARQRGASEQEIIDIQKAGERELEDISKRAFERQQKFAIAVALIDTYLAAQKAYASQIIPGDPTSVVRASIAAGVAVVAGLAKVAVIASQRFEGAGGGGGTGGAGANSTGYNSSGGQILNPFGTPGGGTNILPPRLAPPSGGGVGGSQQVKAGFGGEQTPVVRAYVLAGDVTEAVDAEARLNQKRTL